MFRPPKVYIHGVMVDNRGEQQQAATHMILECRRLSRPIKERKTGGVGTRSFRGGKLSKAPSLIQLGADLHVTQVASRLALSTRDFAMCHAHSSHPLAQIASQPAYQPRLILPYRMPPRKTSHIQTRIISDGTGRVALSSAVAGCSCEFPTASPLALVSSFIVTFT